VLRLTDLMDAKVKHRRKSVDLGLVLANQLELTGGPFTGFVREHRFHPTRAWRLDLAWPQIKLGVECEGVGAGGKPGRHQLTQHIHDNCEKHSALAAMGWRLIRVTGRQVRNGTAHRWIEAALIGERDGRMVAAEAFDQPWDGGASRRRAAAKRRLRRLRVT
jgi:very-short-patch-repair endonuclease